MLGASEESMVYEEDLRKKFYTEAKVFWSKKKRLELRDGSYYIYQTILRVTEDDIEVYDFDGGLDNLCNFVLPKYVPDWEELNRRKDLNRNISLLLPDIDRLRFYKEEMTSFPLSKRPKECRAYRRKHRKEFLKRLDEVLSQLMDLYNWYTDI